MILVVGGIKGGIGKSTIAANMAVLAMLAGKSTLLVDTDVDQATTTLWAAARAESHRHADLTTIALSGRGVVHELERLRSKFDVIVVDAAARDSDTQRGALLAADVVLLPFPPRGPDLWTLDLVASMLTKVRCANDSIRAVAFVNKADAKGTDNDEAESAFAEYADRIESAPIRVGLRKGIAVAHLAGLAACEARRPDEKAVAELDALYSYLFNPTPVR